MLSCPHCGYQAVAMGEARLCLWCESFSVPEGYTRAPNGWRVRVWRRQPAHWVTGAGKEKGKAQRNPVFRARARPSDIAEGEHG